MKNILLTFNMLITVISVINFTGFYLLNKREKKAQYILSSSLFILFFLDNFLVHMAEFSPSFKPTGYPLYIVGFMTILINITIIANMRLIVSYIFNDVITPMEKTLYVLGSISLTLTLIWLQNDILSFIAYLIFFTMFLYIIIKTYNHLRLISNNFNNQKSKIYQVLLSFIILFSFIGISFYAIFYLLPNNEIFYYSDYFRDIPNDMTKLCMGIIGIRFLFNSFSNLSNNTIQSVNKKLDLFCKEYSLTDRQREIIELIIEGHTNRQISELLHITEGTVKTHVHNIFKKTNLSNRTQLVNNIMKK